MHGSRPESAVLVAGEFSIHADRWRGGDHAQVLLLHGLGGNSITWHGVGPILARELGAQVLAIDLPGFGASRPGARRLSLRVLSQVIQAVMQKEGARGARWVLAGNSLGGLLALELACRFPAQVAAVNLAALALPLDWGRQKQGKFGVWQYVPLAVPWQGRRLVERYVTARGVPGVVDDPIKLLFRDPARLDAELRQRLIAVSEYRLTWAADAARAYEQITRSLGLQLIWPGLAGRWIRGAACPVQSISGTHDPLFPGAAWQQLERLRPDWRHVSMPDIGHVPQLEAPAEFADHMLSWLVEELGAGGTGRSTPPA
ncbi:MAG TPA: alpha/beta hydrolase [Polyangiaceae bacterium]|nr:alpha/beta hydrolase [Polyangiaceae bacterium]